MGDVVSVMSTSKYGLDVGAGVLYEREEGFRRGKEQDRTDMRDYLKTRDCSKVREVPILATTDHADVVSWDDETHQSRIEFYLSKVRIVQIPSLIPTSEFCSPEPHRWPDCATPDLASYFQQLTSTYPSAHTIRVLVPCVSTDIAWDVESGRIMTSSATVYCGEGGKEGWVAEAVREVNDQLSVIQGEKVTVTTLHLHCNGWPAFDPTEQITYLGLSLPSTSTPYASLTEFVTSGGFELDWTSLRQILDLAPHLQTISAHIQGSDLTRHSLAPDPPIFGGKTYPQVKDISIHLQFGTIDNIYDCMESLPRLRRGEFKFRGLASLNRSSEELRKYATEITKRREEKPFQPLGEMRSLKLSEGSITTPVMLDLLRYCPNLTELKVKAKPSAGEGLDIVREITQLCPRLISLAIRYSTTDIPIIQALELVTSALPALRTLSLSVSFHPLPTPPTSVNPPTIRWPFLHKINLIFFGAYLEPDGSEHTTQPPPEQVAEMIPHWFSPHAEVVLQETYNSQEVIRGLWEAPVKLLTGVWRERVERRLGEVRREGEGRRKKGWEVIE